MQTLYERLVREHYQYCLGKSPNGLKASCYYLEGIMDKEKHRTIISISKEYDVSDTTIINRSKEIKELLKIKIPNFWIVICDFCGKKIKSRSQLRRLCFTCERSYAKYIWRRWKHANVCMICGELNPLLLLPIGHHIFGEKYNLTIPICANCHELTKPRTRQSFFLFDKWEFPEVKFTQDNSPIYIFVD